VRITFPVVVMAGPLSLSAHRRRLGPVSRLRRLGFCAESFGERALPEGDDDGRSSVAMDGLGWECPDQDWREL